MYNSKPPDVVMVSFIVLSNSTTNKLNVFIN